MVPQYRIVGIRNLIFVNHSVLPMILGLFVTAHSFFSMPSVQQKLDLARSAARNPQRDAAFTDLFNGSRTTDYHPILFVDFSRFTRLGLGSGKSVQLEFQARAG